MEKNSEQKIGPLKAEEKTEEEAGTSLFHYLMAQRKDVEEDVKIVLQRLIVIARLPRDLADRTELGAHYEKLNFQLSKLYTWDYMTGLLLIYPSCLLHVIEVLNADQVAGDLEAKGVEDEESSTETLVCCVLSALQKLNEQLEISKAPPGSVLDETPELIVPQEVLHQLLAREELQSPQQYLQAYNSPLNISMDFGQVIRSSCLTTV
eukprot:superscaffoldBa00001265_g9800